MTDFVTQKVLKQFFYFLIAAVIGSIVYFTIEYSLSNRFYSIITGATIANALFFTMMYRHYRRRERLLGIIEVFKNFEDAPSTMQILEDAHVSVEFLGISGRTFFESDEVEDLMRRKIRQGVNFGFVILEPTSQFVKEKAEDEGDDPEAWRLDINASLVRLERLKNETTHAKIAIYKYDSLPNWRAVFVDGKTAYVTYYPHGHRGKHSPVVLLDNRDTTLFIPLYSLYNSLSQP